MALTAAPTAPNIADQSTFQARSQAWVIYIRDVLIPELNAIIGVTIPAGSAAASTLTGNTLASNVLASSLTSLGTLTGLNNAGNTTLGNAASDTVTINAQGILLPNTGDDITQITANGHSDIFELVCNQASGYIAFRDTNAGALRGYVGYGSGVLTGAAQTELAIRAEASLWLGAGGNNLRVYIGGPTGNVKIGANSSAIASRSSNQGTNTLEIFNGTAPVGTLTNGMSIYCTAGEGYTMDAAGNATLQTPHDRETNEWIFLSKDTKTGKVLRIDMERFMKFLNDHHGVDFVHETQD